VSRESVSSEMITRVPGEIVDIDTLATASVLGSSNDWC
jgi:hypothetical protein